MKASRMTARTLTPKPAPKPCVMELRPPELAAGAAPPGLKAEPTLMVGEVVEATPLALARRLRPAIS
jgi:hypothetical protein